MINGKPSNLTIQFSCLLFIAEIAKIVLCFFHSMILLCRDSIFLVGIMLFQVYASFAFMANVSFHCSIAMIFRSRFVYFANVAYPTFNIFRGIIIPTYYPFKKGKPPMSLRSYLKQEVRPNDVQAVDHLNSQIPDACKKTIGDYLNQMIDAGISCCDACCFCESNLQALLKGNAAADKLVADFITASKDDLPAHGNPPNDFPTFSKGKVENTFKLVKSHKGKSHSLKKHKVGDPAPTDFLVDNQDQSFTTNGKDDQGFATDISGIATETVVSSDPTIFSVDTPVGMFVQGHALAPGSIVLSFTAVFNDGVTPSLGYDLPITVSTGPTGRLVIVAGDPVTRPVVPPIVP